MSKNWGPLLGESISRFTTDDAFTLSVTGQHGDGELSFQSKDPSVAIVDEAGKVTIVGAGSTTITVTQTENDTYQPANATTELLVIAAQVMPLNDTGIDGGGDYPDGNNIYCISNIEAPQDCHQGRDAETNLQKDGGGDAGFDFTRINNDGSVYTGDGNYAQNPWACIEDNHTGLMWEVKTPSDGTRGNSGLHDADDEFNWYYTDSNTNGGTDGYADDDGAICYGYDVNDASTYCNTEAFVDRVNERGLCGANNWRLPTREELRSIVHYGRGRPSIDSSYFPNTPASFFWSSSTYAFNSGYAWGVYFHNGYDSPNDRNGYSLVRLVRWSQ